MDRDIEISSQDPVRGGEIKHGPGAAPSSKAAEKPEIRDAIETGRAGEGGASVPSESNLPVLPAQKVSDTQFRELLPVLRELLNLPSTEAVLKRLDGSSIHLLRELEAYLNTKAFLILMSENFPLSTTSLANGAGKDRAPSLEESLVRFLRDYGEMAKEAGFLKDLPLALKKGAEELFELAARQSRDPNRFSRIEEAASRLSSSMKEFQIALKQVRASLKRDPSASTEELREIIGGWGIGSEGRQMPHGQLKDWVIRVLEHSGLESLKSLLTILEVSGKISLIPLHNRPQIANSLLCANCLPLQNGEEENHLFVQLGENVGSRISELTQEIGLNTAHGVDPSIVPVYFSSVMSQLILSAALMGRLMAGNGDRMGETSSEMKIGGLNLYAIRDLKIFDLVPFSFLAFFVPLQQREEDTSDAVKAAYSFLMQLIRVLMKLTYMLVAIVSGGQKMGEGGEDRLLADNSRVILETLDQLSFALKKVNELFGVEVAGSLAALNEAKTSLIQEDYENFWPAAFMVLNHDGQVKDLLQQFEDAEPFYRAVQGLFGIV